MQFSDSKQQNIVVNAPLSISKAASSTAARGANVAYTITLINGGSSTALNATISDTLPATTTFVSMTGTGAFHDGCSFDAANNRVECLAVDVPTGFSKLSVLAKTSAATPLGTLTNTATITTAGTGTIAIGTANANTNITP
ncbi:MAG: hypothetical protein ABI831_26415 [Betaproteobacteria bacterium]